MSTNILRTHVKSSMNEIRLLEIVIVERIKTLISKVDLTRVGEVLSFNVRLHEALQRKSLLDLKILRKEVLQFPA